MPSFAPVSPEYRTHRGLNQSSIYRISPIFLYNIMTNEKPKNLEELLGDSIPKQPDQDQIGYIAIIGLGVMGRGICQTVAAAGLDVLGVERNADVAKQSLTAIQSNLDREIQRWAITKSERQSILSRIKITDEIEQIAECDLVIEAIDEDFSSKQKLFQMIDSLCPPNSIIISNTSTLNLTKLAEKTGRADRIIGMHFLQPVPKIPLVEIIRALKTSDQTYLKVKEFAEYLGKTVVEVYEYPGFVTTRVIVPMLNEAMHVLMEGIANADGIDTAMRLGYNLTMGPLELADTIGLDQVHTWMDALFHELGDSKYRPCPILKKLVREGKLGKKVGEGFFKYNEVGQKISPSAG
jgi:3-hydroxybutyryl-CoA dehydrogenase